MKIINNFNLDVESWRHENVMEWMKQRRGFSAQMMKKFAEQKIKINGQFLLYQNLATELKEMNMSKNDRNHMIEEVDLLKKQMEKCRKGTYISYFVLFN